MFAEEADQEEEAKGETTRQHSTTITGHDTFAPRTYYKTDFDILLFLQSNPIESGNYSGVPDLKNSPG